MTYEFSAGEAERFVTVSTNYKLWQDRERWKNNFIYVAKKVQHTARLTQLAIQLIQAEAGDDQDFKTAARGKLMAAIGGRII